MKTKRDLIIEGIENVKQVKVDEGFKITFGGATYRTGKKLFSDNYDTCVVYEAIDVDTKEVDGILITSEYFGKTNFGCYLSKYDFAEFKKLL